LKVGCHGLSGLVRVLLRCEWLLVLRRERRAILLLLLLLIISLAFPRFIAAVRDASHAFEFFAGVHFAFDGLLKM
jgi:hypothetical protein